jgi:quinoprotein glucose dehydrogenase
MNEMSEGVRLMCFDKRLRAVLGASLVFFAAGNLALAQQGAADGQWPYYAGDIGSTKYSPLDQINSGNVTRLRIAWRRPAVDQTILDRVPNLSVTKNLTSTPLMVDGILYSSNGVGLAEAFDPATGETVWIQGPLDSGPQAYRGAETRGVAYWSDGRDQRIMVQRGQYLIALNAKTGKPYSDFGDGGRVNLTSGLGGDARYRWTGVPLVVGDVVVMGQSMTDTFITKEAVRGDVRAFDVRTGELRWVFHTVPQAGEFGTDSWDDDSWAYTGHAPVWSLMSADPDLGYVYLPVTSPTSDMYGGHRGGDNLYGQSLVCVDAATGERVWHYQLVHHGLWDYDLPTAPILMDLEVEGRPGITKMVVQLTKQAFAFAFDRATGEPIWPIEERPVPQSTTPGEKTSPTQPFPTKPPAFDRQGATVENLIDFTPELHKEALEIVSHYTIGPMFMPPTVRTETNLGTIQLPGSQGGADVQGGAFDPESGYMYVPSITAPFVADIVGGNPDRTNLRYVKGRRLWIGGPRGLPLFKPPYGRITAFDMTKGEIVWQVPNGNGPRNHPAIRHLNLGRLGRPGRPSPLLTKTLLFIGEGSRARAERGADRIPEGMPVEIVTNYGEPWFRAYDKSNGDVLWEIELPGGTTGAPMSYIHKGKQYVVVAIEELDEPAQWVAFSLP